MVTDMTGKTMVITGAGRGIGRECAVVAAQHGADVIAVARSSSDLASLKSEFPQRIQAWSLDVTGDEIVNKLNQLKQIDVLINNAGGNRPAAFDEVADTDLDFILDLNVRSAFRISQAVVKNMLRNNTEGSIVHMSSQMGHVGSPKRTVYCMTKHAIEGLTKAMAVELAPKGIRVNSVAPTFVETPLTKPMLADKDFHDFVMGMIPMKKLASVTDVVNAVMFLASDNSAMVTGHSLKVDGGWTVQ